MIKSIKHDCSHGNHVHGHNCDHHHTHNVNKTILLTLDDYSTMECNVLNIFEVNEQLYIALLPKGKNNAMLYRFKETNDGPQLDNIESEEEYKTVGKIFLNIIEGKNK